MSQAFIKKRSAARAAIRSTIRCARCQIPFAAMRSTKQYCSDRCRVAAGRPAHQRRVRTIEAERDPRPVMATLDGAKVERIGYAEAKALVLRYEWLGVMPALTAACYGLTTAEGELAGVTVFGPGMEWRVGGYLVWLDESVVNNLGRLRGHSEDLSAVIVRLFGEQANEQIAELLRSEQGPSEKGRK